jgi:Lon protease-like protein
MQQLGVLSLKTRGEQRFRILSHEANSVGLVTAEVELIEHEEKSPVPEEFGACLRLLQLVVADQGQKLFAEPHAFDDASWVGYRLTEILPVPLLAKQKLLELTDSQQRLIILQRFLEQQGLATEGEGKAKN